MRVASIEFKILLKNGHRLKTTFSALSIHDHLICGREEYRQWQLINEYSFVDPIRSSYCLLFNVLPDW